MTRRQLLALLAALPIVRFLPDVNALAVEPKAEPIITVTKKDGTLVKGRVVSADWTKVTIGVMNKPSDTPVNTDIAWDDIKSMSNGLTREKAGEQWKRDNGDKLCETCHGDGKVFCSTCHGTGHDPEAGKDCPTCKSAEQVACTTPHCDKGTIPCPRTCLKLSDSGWYTKPDGSKWKKFPVKNGYQEWSEHHVGQLIEKLPDGGWGNKGICPTCAGKSKVADLVCHGTGVKPCTICTNRKTSPVCPAGCDKGFVTCDTCKGTGAKT